MKRINPYQVLNLTPPEESLCLSLYANSEAELARLMEQAETLALQSADGATADKLLKPLHVFARGLGRGESAFPLALFSTRGFSGYSRLPFTTRPLTVLADSFHVKPLLKWTQREHPFSLLLLGEQEAVLYQGSLTHFAELERLPYREIRTMDGAFNALDRAVYRSIQSSRVPLVLAGDLELIEIYRNVSSYRAIVEDAIVDPSVCADTPRLHAEAVRCLEPFLQSREASLLQAYWSAQRSGRTSSALQEIVMLALARRVKHLFVNERMHVWGKIDRQSGRVSYSPRQTEMADDVLDDLAEIVLRAHGTVTVLPSSRMPNGQAACAILSGEALSLRVAMQRLREDNAEQQAVG